MSLWVYPILNELSFMYRGLFLLGLALFSVGLYFIGEMYTLALTGKDQFVLHWIPTLIWIILGLRMNKTVAKKKKKY